MNQASPLSDFKYPFLSFELQYYFSPIFYVALYPFNVIFTLLKIFLTTEFAF